MGGQTIAECLLQFKQKDKWLIAGKRRDRPIFSVHGL